MTINGRSGFALRPCGSGIALLGLTIRPCVIGGTCKLQRHLVLVDLLDREHGIVL